MTKFSTFVSLGLLLVLLSANACGGPGGSGKKGYELQPVTTEDADELEQSPTGREWR